MFCTHIHTHIHTIHTTQSHHTVHTTHTTQYTPHSAHHTLRTHTLYYGSTKTLVIYHFPASELVDWFVSSGEVEFRDKGVELGQLLVNTDYIHHVVDEHFFEDGYLFFRFRVDGMPAIISNCMGQNVTFQGCFNTYLY